MNPTQAGAKLADMVKPAASDPRPVLTVRLVALAENYRELVRLASPAAIAPVVKADAYSLGMEPVAQRLIHAGADTFFVARIEEGIELRRTFPAVRIFVLDGLAPGAAPAFVAHGLTPVLNAIEEISDWSAYARQCGSTLDAAIQVDTGMNRSGLSLEDTARLATEVRTALAGVNLALIMSHLACADDPHHALNRLQLDRFRAALAMLPPAPASLAATAGVGLGRDYLFDLVRPGIGLYGGCPQIGQPNPYRTVAALTGKVLQMRRVERGETVGYGATFTAPEPCLLAIVPLGYADGLIRVMGRRGFAVLGGMRVPFAGRISMDLVALDITRLPSDTACRGAEVEFLGDNVTLEDLALAADTINHEILTSLGSRVHRVYVEA